MPSIVRNRNREKEPQREIGKGSLASVAWPAKNLILSSCPQRSEGFLHVLSRTLASPFPPLFPLPHLSPQFDIQHSPHQASVPPALLFLALLAFLPAPSVHLPLCSDGGGRRRGWRGLTHSGSAGSVAPLGLVRGALPGKSQSLSPGDSRLFSAGWEGGGVIFVSQLPQSSQLFPQN